MGTGPIPSPASLGVYTFISFWRFFPLPWVVSFNERVHQYLTKHLRGFLKISGSLCTAFSPQLLSCANTGFLFPSGSWLPFLKEFTWICLGPSSGCLGLETLWWRGRHRAYLICSWCLWAMIKLTPFISLSLRKHCLLLPDRQCLEKPQFIGLAQVFSNPVNSVPNILCCPEGEVIHLICQCFVAVINFGNDSIWSVKTLREISL